MEAQLAKDSELVIMRGPNFVSTFLLSDFSALEVPSRYELFDHLYLMCQFEVGSVRRCDAGVVLQCV